LQRQALSALDSIDALLNDIGKSGEWQAPR
jgi:hypothetical protein